jgi:hypothetical protein
MDTDLVKKIKRTKQILHSLCIFHKISTSTQLCASGQAISHYDFEITYLSDNTHRRTRFFLSSSLANDVGSLLRHLQWQAELWLQSSSCFLYKVLIIWKVIPYVITKSIPQKHLPICPNSDSLISGGQIRINSQVKSFTHSPWVFFSQSYSLGKQWHRSFSLVCHCDWVHTQAHTHAHTPIIHTSIKQMRRLIFF